jgi:hypothetical protein
MTTVVHQMEKKKRKKTKKADVDAELQKHHDVIAEILPRR